MKNLGFFLVLVTWIGCYSPSQVCNEVENAHYKIDYYYGNKDKARYTEYFNQYDQLLRHWRPAEEVINFIYDNEGRLSEIRYSRGCQSVLEYLYHFYDERNEIANTHASKVPISNL